MSCLSSCMLGLKPTPPGPPARVVERIVPLPGGLDRRLLLDSNSPEVISRPGILVSTLPDTGLAFLDLPFQGTFGVFSHHIARDRTPGARLLYLGLLATNRGRGPVVLDREAGASFLSQPDAPFAPLPPRLVDPSGRIFAGPGDRVASSVLHGRFNLASRWFRLAPGQSCLLYDLPIPTNVPVGPPINGRTTWLRLHCQGPVYLSEVAVFAKGKPGSYRLPRLLDFEALLARKLLAGPRELPATPMSARGSLPPGPFQYGRVAGVARGLCWSGILPVMDAQGQPLGFPIASVVCNKLGTSQVQSARLVRRYPGTAYWAHGNYGVTYRLTIPLANSKSSPRTFALTLSAPLAVHDDEAIYGTTGAIVFRGPVKLAWRAGRYSKQSFVHLVIARGQIMPPLMRWVVPAEGHLTIRLTLSYPADATPPELLTIASGL